MKPIGITTTVPVEVLLAAGYQPVDLNNVFIMGGHSAGYIERAERDGFPQSTCAWIKGIYGTCLAYGLRDVLGVAEGDCSNTRALMDVLRLRGITVHPFRYPQSRNYADLSHALQELAAHFGVTLSQAEEERRRLQPLRTAAAHIDELTWREGKVTGFENHLYQVSMSDFGGPPVDYLHTLQAFTEKAERRAPTPKTLRLGFLGVPPMTADLYDFVETLDARVIYNEVQREFAFPRAAAARDLTAQYLDYTYPYDAAFRVREINRQIALRRLDAVIHYTQAFCYRAIEDIVLKQALPVPVLTLEGDKSDHLDARTRLRLEAFLDMLHDGKERRA